MIVLLICSNKNSWLLHLNLTYDILFHRKMEISSVIDMKMDMAYENGYGLHEKSYYDLLELPLSFVLGWSSYVVSITETVYKKIEAFFVQ